MLQHMPLKIHDSVHCVAVKVTVSLPLLSVLVLDK